MNSFFCCMLQCCVWLACTVNALQIDFLNSNAPRPQFAVGASRQHSQRSEHVPQHIVMCSSSARVTRIISRAVKQSCA